jgi:alcohol dehydrogenase class IV
MSDKVNKEPKGVMCCGVRLAGLHMGAQGLLGSIYLRISLAKWRATAEAIAAAFQISGMAAAQFDTVLLHDYLSSPLGASCLLPHGATWASLPARHTLITALRGDW